MNKGRRIIVFATLLLWIFICFNNSIDIPWFETTSQPTHRVGVILSTILVFSVFFWLARQSLLFKNRAVIFALGGLIVLTGIGYLAVHDENVQQAFLNKPYAIYKDKFYYINENDELVALQEKNPHENVTYTRQRQIITTLPFNVRISKSRPLQDMHGKWKRYMSDPSVYEIVWIENGKVHNRKPETEE